MSNLDRMIDEALDAEDRAILEGHGEQGLFAQAASVYQGRQSWIAFLMTLVMIALFVTAVIAAWKFVQADDIAMMIKWGAAAWLLTTMVAFMKLWFWLRMESNRVLREVKRVELQVARLGLK